MYDLLGIAVHRVHITFVHYQYCYLRWNRYLYPSTTMEVMADNVLSEIDYAFMEENADEIIQFANEQFAGSIDIDKRGRYQSIFLTLGGRQEICWTCGGSLKHLGKRLEKWL